MKLLIVISLILFAIGCKSSAKSSAKSKSTDSSSAGTTLVQKTGKISLNGLTINYLEAGNGPLLILIHGSVSDYREWSKQINELGQQYHVLAYSRRYHWPNSPPGSDADVSVEQQANDLSAIIKSAGTGPANIVAHSFGGTIALNFTLQHPELVKSLVLLEPAVAGVLNNNSKENDTILKESQAIRAEMKEVFTTGDAEQIVKTYANHVAPGDYDRETPEERNMLLENVKAFTLDYNSPRPPFTCADAQKISKPVLVMSGDQSPLGLQRIAETTAQCIKGAKFVKIAGATHWLQHDQPQTFNKELLAFLAQIKN